MIRLEGVSRSYETGSTTVYALKDVSLTFNPGEFGVIMGPSGSGKSTLLNVLGCLDRPTEGKYHLDDVEVTALADPELVDIRRNKLGMIFQAFHLVPRMTAQRNVELPMIFAAMDRKERAEKAIAALESVGLGPRVHHRPDELSGGERQRVAIARALVMDPTLLLADEPTGNLDSVSGAEIMNLLQELNGRGRTILMVTHDDEVAEAGSRLVRLRDGQVEEDRAI